jgi:hypothetical protein
VVGAHFVDHARAVQDHPADSPVSQQKGMKSVPGTGQQLLLKRLPIWFLLDHLNFWGNFRFRISDLLYRFALSFLVK